jgi:hypothetical protein
VNDLNEDRHMKRKIPGIALLAVTAALTGACATHSGSDDEFGAAVRTVMSNQTFDPEARAYPSGDAVTGGNADRLEKVVEAHADSTGDAQSVRRPLEVGLGN